MSASDRNSLPCGLGRRRYRPPECLTQAMRETAALACGKILGQLACRRGGKMEKAS